MAGRKKGSGAKKLCPSCGEQIENLAKECSCGWKWESTQLPKKVIDAIHDLAGMVKSDKIVPIHLSWAIKEAITPPAANIQSLKDLVQRQNAEIERLKADLEKKKKAS